MEIVLKYFAVLFFSLIPFNGFCNDNEIILSHFSVFRLTENERNQYLKGLDSLFEKNKVPQVFMDSLIYPRNSDVCRRKGQLTCHEGLYGSGACVRPKATSKLKKCVSQRDFKEISDYFIKPRFNEPGWSVLVLNFSKNCSNNRYKKFCKKLSSHSGKFIKLLKQRSSFWAERFYYR